jgi:hypothetical protein
MTAPPWTGSELCLLRDMVSKGLSSFDIARLLERTPSAIRTRKSKLGIKSPLQDRPVRDPDPSNWTQADRISEWADVPQRLAELVVEGCAAANLDVRAVRSASRHQELVECRWRIAAQARIMGYSYPAIGRALNRDHTTIMHAVQSDAKRRAA